MGLHDPFGHLKHKLRPKERPRIKLVIWLLTTKSRNRLDFLMCRWWGTYPSKALDEGYNFFLDFITIGGLHTKLWGPKVGGVSILGISGLPNGSLRTKCHLDVAPMDRHKLYYKGEGGGSPQVQVVVNLLISSLLMVRLNTKNAQTMR
jgi:hypothetical protein